MWKGKKARYMAFHNFARRHFGRPKLCEMCGDNSRKMYHWAAKDHGKGGRKRHDWLRLCVPCHALYDGRVGKGTKPKRTAEHRRNLSEALKGNRNRTKNLK